MEPKNLALLEKRVASEVLAGLNSTDSIEGARAAGRLLAEAREYGLSLKDYLRASIKPKDEEEANLKLDGYELALKDLGIPLKRDLNCNADLRAASDTFATRTGTRVLFQDVISDIVKWNNGQDSIVTVNDIISQSRTITGNSQIQMDLDGAGAALDAFKMFQIAEGGEIPVRKIGTTERSVKIFKVGHGYEFTYEFSRRVNIDIITPYVNRSNREFELDKVRYATSILVNGDGVAGAITVDANTTYGGTAGTLSWSALFGWLVARAAAGFPIDTLIGNYATYGDLMALFTPTVNTQSIPKAMESVGGPQLAPKLSFMKYAINFAISNTVAAKNFVGIIKSETIEELVEAGSDIQESERIMNKQKMVFYKTLNVGYNLSNPYARRGFSYA